jgi:hypothetical protein
VNPTQNEKDLDAICLRNKLLAHEVHQIADPTERARAMALYVAIAEEKNAKMAKLTRGESRRLYAARRLELHLERRIAMAERSAKYAEEQKQRVRRALAESQGRKAPAQRLTRMATTTFNKWYTIVKAEDAVTPIPRCPMCGAPLPPLDRAPTAP